MSKLDYTSEYPQLLEIINGKKPMKIKIKITVQFLSSLKHLIGFNFITHETYFQMWFDVWMRAVLIIWESNSAMSNLPNRKSSPDSPIWLWFIYYTVQLNWDKVKNYSFQKLCLYIHWIISLTEWSISSFRRNCLLNSFWHWLH